MTVRMRVEVPKNLPGFGRFQTELLAAIRDSQQIVVNQARENVSAHTKTGAVRRSITAEELQINGNKIIAPIGAGGAGAPYARGLEEGTGLYGPAHKRYLILPVHGKALAWPAASMGAPGGAFRRLSGAIRTSVRRAGKAEMIIRRSVNHPGHKPMPFLRPALDDSIPKIMDRIQKAIDKVFGSS